MIFSGSDLEGINTYFISFTKLFPLSFFCFSYYRVYKDSESPGSVEIQQKVVSRAHLQLPD